MDSLPERIPCSTFLINILGVDRPFFGKELQVLPEARLFGAHSGHAIIVHPPFDRVPIRHIAYVDVASLVFRNHNLPLSL